MKKFDQTLQTMVLALLVFLPMSAFASAYQNYLQSVNSAGYAHADMSSQASDASTAYYNPAGMTRIKEGCLEIGVIGYEQKNQYRNKLKPVVSAELQQGAIAFIESLIGTSIPIESLDLYLPRANNNTFNTLPNFHIVQPIACAPWDLTVGLSVVSPWTYESDYNNALVTTLYADKTSVNSLLINPSIAFKPFRELSIGLGLDFQEIRTFYSTSVLILGIDSKLSGWKTSCNIGALYELNCCTRFGVTYRPRVTYNLTGKTKLLAGKFNAKDRFITPGTVTFGLFYQPNCRTSLMATAVYTMWDAVRRISIRSAVPPLAVEEIGISFSNFETPLHWRSTWFFALGGDYRINENWLLKGGLAYDRTPTSSKHREIRYPDQDRYHFSFGLRYSFCENLMFDFAYQYIYMPSAAIKFSQALPFNILEQTGQPGNIYTAGHTSGHKTVLGGELIWKW